MGTGGDPPLPEVGVEYEKIDEILDPVAMEGVRNILESVVFEIFRETDTVNEVEDNTVSEVEDYTVNEVDDDSRLEEQHNSLAFMKPEILKPSAVPNKPKRLAETLQVSTKISEEIKAKTALKQEYYTEKQKMQKKILP
ncbi:hypothetical protein JTB14_004027 [Gonioctena quinquepunctata]|nr:hypothetical protein JTB14_004027 [Gonioctena quinquepunctata]